MPAFGLGSPERIWFSTEFLPRSFAVRVIEKTPIHLRRRMIRASAIGVLLVAATCPLAGQTESEWQQQVQNEVQVQHLDAALTIVDQRLANAPDDLEAHGWHGRLLAWKGRWTEGEAEYKFVLERVPNDIDILTGLADVLVWQRKYSGALQVLNHARTIAPSDPEILSRRARVLALLGRTGEAQLEYQQVLQFDPENKEARASLLENTKHELRVGDDIDFFNYTGNAQTESVSLSSRWNSRWSTVFGVSTYQRFGQDAVKLQASGAFHLTAHTWASVGTAVANDQGVVPTNEAFFELGHGFRFDNRWVQGLESSYQQHWFWYQGAHVLTFSTNQIVYLPKGWTWSLDITGARSGFVGTPVAWEPSGWSKLGFPLYRHVSGNVLFGMGSENFSQIDQVGQFSAHTYGGGLRYQFLDRQDVQGYVSRQQRSQGQTDTTLGLSYGIRF
jgi:tetratricopeptide (TPR) repeat protein